MSSCIFYILHWAWSKGSYYGVMLNKRLVFSIFRFTLKRNIENNWRSLMEHTQNRHIKAICSVLVCFALTAILFRPLWPTSGKTKLGHQNGSSFFRFHDHFVTLLLHYFLLDPKAISPANNSTWWSKETY